MMTRKFSLMLILILLSSTTIVAACSPLAEPDAIQTESLDSTQPVRQHTITTVITPRINLTEEETMPSKPMPASTSGPSANRLVTQAKQDLAQRLSIDVDQIQLVEFEAVVWPDGGLGCPEPGVVYIQVPQDGALIRLEAGGKVYEYHSGGGREPFLCERFPRIDKSTPLPGLGDQ